MLLLTSNIVINFDFVKFYEKKYLPNKVFCISFNIFSSNECEFIDIAFPSEEHRDVGFEDIATAYFSGSKVFAFKEINQKGET